MLFASVGLGAKLESQANDLTQGMDGSFGLGYDFYLVFLAGALAAINGFLLLRKTMTAYAQPPPRLVQY